MKYLLLTVLLLGCNTPFGPKFKVGDCIKFELKDEFKPTKVWYKRVEKVGKENYLLGDLRYTYLKLYKLGDLYYDSESFYWIDKYNSLAAPEECDKFEKEHSKHAWL